MRRRGFTLIELLTVLAIMTILAGILFPVFLQARDAARRANCLSSLRQLALAHRIYVEDYDDTLPSWELGRFGRNVIWTEFLRPYYRDPQILDQGFTDPATRAATGWTADYSLCAWGPGGEGTLADPYWLWPGALWTAGDVSKPMTLAEVRRPAESLQFADGTTDTTETTIRRAHRNGQLNGAFLDGHARVVTDAEWNRIGQDERGYFYRIAAADR